MERSSFQSGGPQRLPTAVETSVVQTGPWALRDHLGPQWPGVGRCCQWAGHAGLWTPIPIYLEQSYLSLFYKCGFYILYLGLKQEHHSLQTSKTANAA